MLEELASRFRLRRLPEVAARGWDTGSCVWHFGTCVFTSQEAPSILEVRREATPCFDSVNCVAVKQRVLVIVAACLCPP